VDWVCKNWRLADEGIWETRGGRQQFVYSKVMCWVAIDRALRIAEARGLPAKWGPWVNARNEIYMDVMANGWSPQRRAFVQYYGCDTLDAANLVMPLVRFCSPTEPR